MSKHFVGSIYLSLFSVWACLAIAVTACAASEEHNTADKKLQVQVYYEALCPDSMDFIRKQLYPSMIDKDRLPYTQLDFVPYGKVTSWTDPQTNVTTLFCQHGRAECENNAVQACIVEHNTIKEQLQLINCLLKSYKQDLDKCAKNLSIDVEAAKNCKATRSTDDILKKYGEQTDAIRISFVPSIGINGTLNRSEQSLIRDSFDEVFCKKYQEKYNVLLNNC